VLIIPSLGVPNWSVIYIINTGPSSKFSGAVAREREDFCKGSLARTIFYFVFSFALFYFCLHLFIKSTKKISFLYGCFYLLAFSFARMGTPENTKLCDFTSTKNNDFVCTPIVPPTPEANFFEIKPALINLIMKEQFSGASSDDAAAHLNNFVELCEIQKYKDVDVNIIKLKLFPFSLRGRVRIGCYFCLEIVLILGISVKMLLLENIILLLRL
jgi:hypothetical protein